MDWLRDGDKRREISIPLTFGYLNEADEAFGHDDSQGDDRRFAKKFN